MVRVIYKGEILENIVGVYFELCNLEEHDRIRSDINISVSLHLTVMNLCPDNSDVSRPVPTKTFHSTFKCKLTYSVPIFLKSKHYNSIFGKLLTFIPLHDMVAFAIKNLRFYECIYSTKVKLLIGTNVAWLEMHYNLHVHLLPN